jgi:hypothetical protein
VPADAGYAHYISYALLFVSIWCRSAQTTTDYYTRRLCGDDVTLRMAKFAFDAAHQLSAQFAVSSAIVHLDYELGLASLNCFPPASDFEGMLCNEPGVVLFRKDINHLMTGIIISLVMQI